MDESLLLRTVASPKSWANQAQRSRAQSSGTADPQERPLLADTDNLMARRYCLLGTCDPGVLTWTIVPAEDSLCTLHGGCPQVATLLDILFLFCVSVREQAGFFFFAWVTRLFLVHTLSCLDSGVIEKAGGLALVRPDPIFLSHAAYENPLILFLPTWQLLEGHFPVTGELEA